MRERVTVEVAVEELPQTLLAAVRYFSDPTPSVGCYLASCLLVRRKQALAWPYAS